jgi:CHAT domain-containing protein
VPDARALQATLQTREAIVAYAWHGSSLTAVVVRRDGLHLATLPTEGLQRTIEQVRFQINGLRFGAPALARHGDQMRIRVHAHLQSLYRLLWQPLEPWLAGAGAVTVVPHRALHYVPFSALDDGRSPLCERLAIAVAPSFGQPRAGANADRPAPGGRVVVAGIGGPELPHVQAEIDAVAQAYGDSAVVLTDADVTQKVLRDALDGASVLHLACHGRFRSDSPYFSSLRLADGDLTLRDASTLPLNGVRVVLSACETGLSRLAPGDELVGLVRGFLMAGACEVTASLWTVDDASTALLMARYHRGLRAGRAASVALREAQCAVRATHPHPYHWAPFTVCRRH